MQIAAIDVQFRGKKHCKWYHWVIASTQKQTKNTFSIIEVSDVNKRVNI